MTTKEMEKRKETAPAEKKKSMPTYRPKVDIVEMEEALFLTADMPGVDDKGVNIELEGHELHISGTSMVEDPETMSLSHQEYRACNYERSFTLGNTIDRNAIEASMKDGVLRLKLPKAKEAKPKKIKVNAG